MSQSTVMPGHPGIRHQARQQFGGAAQRRYLARSTLWLSAMRLLVPATALELMLSQTQYFTANPIADSVRWTLILVICVMIVLRPRGRLPLRKPAAADWAALIFVAFAMVSMVYSANRTLTFQRSLSTALLYFAVFWTVWHYADMVGGRRIMQSLLAMTVLMFAVGVVSTYTNMTPLMRGRFIGVFANPNAIGMLASLYLPIATAYYLRTRKASALLIIVLIAGSLLFSGSRNGVLASSLGLLLMFSRLHAWKAWVLLAIAGTIFYLTIPDVSQNELPQNKALSRLITTDNIETGGGRVEAWQAAIPIIQQKIYFGYGFGTEDLIFRGMKFRVHRGAYIHNSYLGLTYQLGITGAAVLFLPLIILLGKRILYHRVAQPEIAAYEGVLLAGLAACFFESWIYSAGNAFAFPFWVFVMLLVRNTMGLIDPEPPRVPKASARFRSPYYRVAPVPAISSGSKPVPRFDPPEGGRA